MAAGVRTRVFFSEVFDVPAETLRSYGAFNISLRTDLPLFIDPFLLFCSSKTVYNDLHDSIIEYLCFLRDHAVSRSLTESAIDEFYRFSEVKENWLGFTSFGNQGHALGSSFAKQLHSSLSSIFADFGEEQITESSHLEKLCLVQSGVGKDCISDFTTNLIKAFLLEYTETFAERYINSRHLRYFVVERAFFDFRRGMWRSRSYRLPTFSSRFVLLTPMDMLTKDDTWINRSHLHNNYDALSAALPNGELRDRVNFHFKKEMRSKNRKGAAERREAVRATLQNYPILIDYYIRQREDCRATAVVDSEIKVEVAGRALIENSRHFIEGVSAETGVDHRTKHTSTRDSILFLRAIAQFASGGGREFLRAESGRAFTEPDLRLFLGLVWLGLVPAGTAEPLAREGRWTTANNLPITVKTASSRTLVAMIDKLVRLKHADTLLLIVAYSFDDWQRIRNLLRKHSALERPEIVLVNATEPAGTRF